jgi:hypothetical protein
MADKFKPLPDGLSFDLPWVTSPQRSIGWTLPGSVYDEGNYPNESGLKIYLPSGYRIVTTSADDGIDSYSKTVTINFETVDVPGSYSAGWVTDTVESGTFPGPSYQISYEDEGNGNTAIFKTEPLQDPVRIGSIVSSGEFGSLDLTNAASQYLSCSVAMRDFLGSSGLVAFIPESFNSITSCSISAQEDIRDDFLGIGDSSRYGFNGYFSADVSVTKRKNEPVIYTGSEVGSYTGMDCYNTGNDTVQVSGLIDSNHWRDEFGTYTRRDESALDLIGQSDSTIRLPSDPSNSDDFTSDISFIGKDGVTDYRVMMAIGNYNLPSFEVIDSFVIIVPAGELVTHTFSDFVEGADSISFVKLEELIEGVGYVEIPWLGGEFESNPAFDITPTDACMVMFTARIRNGTRWGHDALMYVDPMGDEQNKPKYKSKRVTKSFSTQTE